jgi:GT2 family glycosyltransferase
MHYRVFYENSGLGYARQLVVDNAEGDLIVWVDGDLVLPTDFIRKQVEFMEKNPRVGIGKGKYGLHEEHSVVADLENVEFVLGFAREGETSSKALATAGSIFRVKAVRQAGGFDTSIKGVGEDMDVERRIKASGWLLCVTPAVFHEIRRSTWSSLWKEYFWHGHGGYYLFKKNKDFIEYYKMFPPILFIIELLKIPAAYRLLKRKVVFLLPFHYAFKRVAWIFGFLRNYLVTN